jgi:hypothetical protein
LDRFDVLILKIIFKKIKKYHFDAFRHEKHFEKQPQLHSQTDPGDCLKNASKRLIKKC